MSAELGSAVALRHPQLSAVAACSCCLLRGEPWRLGVVLVPELSSLVSSLSEELLSLPYSVLLSVLWAWPWGQSSEQIPASQEARQVR